MPIGYPTILTDKAWQKQKGPMAKTKSTGLGKTLIALEKEYKLTEFATTDPGDLAKKTLDPLSYAKRRASLTLACGVQGKKLVELVAKSAAAAKSAKTTFAKDKKLVAYLTQIEQALTTFKNDFGPNGQEVKNLVRGSDQAYKERLESSHPGAYTKKNTAQLTERARQDAIAMIQRVRAAGTIAALSSEFAGDGPHRKLTTACELWDNFYVRDCPDLAKSIYSGKTKVQFGHLPFVWEAANEANGDLTAAAQKIAAKSSEAAAVTAVTTGYGKSMNAFKEFVAHMTAFEAEVRKWL